MKTKIVKYKNDNSNIGRPYEELIISGDMKDVIELFANEHKDKYSNCGREWQMCGWYELGGVHFNKEGKIEQYSIRTLNEELCNIHYICYPAK